MDLNHGLLKYIVAKVLTLGFERNIIFFLPNNIWAL